MPMILNPDSQPIFKIRLKKELKTNMYFLYQIFERIKKGYSPIVAICGRQRIGKSFVGVWLCYTFMRLMNEIYDPTQYTFYDPIDAIENLEHLSKKPLLIDEASSILDNREWFAKTHTALKEIINTQGYKSMLYVFITPFLIDVDKAFIKHFDFLIRVHQKGFFKAFRYHKRYDALRTERAIIPIFLDDVRIPMSAVPSDIWEKYNKFSIEQKELLRKRRIEKLKQKEKIKKIKKSDDIIGYFEDVRV